MVADLLQVLLKRHKSALQAATELLLERDTLQGTDLEDILAAHPPATEPKDDKIWEVSLKLSCLLPLQNCDCRLSQQLSNFKTPGPCRM